MLRKRLKKIEEKQKEHVGRIYEIKKKVTGMKKQAMLPTSVVNPKTGKLAVTKKKLKRFPFSIAKTPCQTIPLLKRPSEGMRSKTVCKMLDLKSLMGIL